MPKLRAVAKYCIGMALRDEQFLDLSWWINDSVLKLQQSEGWKQRVRNSGVDEVAANIARQANGRIAAKVVMELLSEIEKRL